MDSSRPTIRTKGERETKQERVNWSLTLHQTVHARRVLEARLAASKAGWIVELANGYFLLRRDALFGAPQRVYELTKNGQTLRRYYAWAG